MMNGKPTGRGYRKELVAFALGSALLLIGIALRPRPALPPTTPAEAAALLTADTHAADTAAASAAWLSPAADRLPERVRGRPIPATFFGLHLLSLGVHGQWPAVPFGLYRTWDGVYRWHTMRPQPDTWYDWALVQLDMLAELADGRAELMFTLAGGGPNGGFPAWLDARAADRTAVHDEWRLYVRTLGERLRGKVRYWEIWNEIDCTCFFDGPTDLLVELTDIAAAELKAIDAGNVVLSAINSIPGSALFDEYLRLGGAAHVDAVAWHIDTPHIPEQDTTKLRTMRALMERHGVGELPLWTTEGHAASFDGASPDEEAGILARQYLVLWAQGSENFSWYAWDVWEYGVYQGRSSWITLTAPGEPARTTAAGVAYGVLADWLIGASMTALVIDGPLWQIEIARPDGGRGLIAWHAEGPAHRIAVPPGTTRIRTLDGRSAGWAGDALATTTSPVLLEW